MFFWEEDTTRPPVFLSHLHLLKSVAQGVADNEIILNMVDVFVSCG